MPRGLVLLAVLLATGEAVSLDEAAPPARGDLASFGAALPGDVGDVSAWTVVSGDFDTVRVRGAYRFYVNPARQAMYQLMRYDVQLLDPRSDLERDRRPGERVVFAAHPGTAEPLLCWSKERGPGSRAWLPVPAGTDAYRLEMMTLMQVLGIHRERALHRDAPSRTAP
jgi:hypothetical protein